MRVTVRLSDHLADHVDSVRQDNEQSDAEVVRNCIERSQQLDDVEGELEQLREELREERSRADRLAGKLESKNETIEAREDHIDSLESTIYEQQQAMQSAVAERRGVVGRIRQALMSADDERQE